jgi:hypothetical protein
MDRDISKGSSDEVADIAAACIGAPAWITPDSVRDTLQTFRPLSK